MFAGLKIYGTDMLPIFIESVKNQEIYGDI